jgi:alpha-glucosidase
MRACVDDMEASLPPFAWPNYVLGNHDQPRLATRFGGQEQARLAGMMLLTLRGTPTVYYGDELGIPNGIIPLEKIQDPQGINLGAHRSRDVCRTPMQWDSGDYAGFSTVEPWLPVTGDYPARNVAVQSQEPGSMLNFYRKLFWLRRRSPALHGGSYQPLDVDMEDECYVYIREHGSERKMIVLNFANRPVTVTTPVEERGHLLLSTHMDREGEISPTCIKLRPHEGLVIDL